MAGSGREDETQLHRNNVDYLRELAYHYADTSPAVSRFYIATANRVMKKKLGNPSSDTSSCPFCGSIFIADNHMVRILPQMKRRKKIRQLLKKRGEVGLAALDSNERRLLAEYTESTSKISITCKVCHKRTVKPCPAKPPPPPEPDKTEPEIVKKKKKRKKKDVTCGLNIPGASQPTLGPQTTSSLPVPPKPVHIKPIAAATPPHTLPSQKVKKKLKHSQLQHILREDKKKKMDASSSSLQTFLSGL